MWENCHQETIVTAVINSRNCKRKLSHEVQLLSHRCDVIEFNRLKLTQSLSLIHSNNCYLHLFREQSRCAWSLCRLRRQSGDFAMCLTDFRSQRLFQPWNEWNVLRHLIQRKDLERESAIRSPSFDLDFLTCSSMKGCQNSHGWRSTQVLVSDGSCCIPKPVLLLAFWRRFFRKVGCCSQNGNKTKILSWIFSRATNCDSRKLC